MKLYFTLLLLQYDALEEPFGDCGSKYLSHYSDDNYTHSKCKKECETKDLEGRCGCKLPDMPGGSI